MARTGKGYEQSYNYDSSEFAENCQHLFEEYFIEDLIVPEKLHHSVISKLLNFSLNPKEPKSLYHALRFDYLHTFFSEVKKFKPIKSLPKGRPKRFITTKKPKRLVVIVVRVSTTDEGNKLIPISVKSKGRTVQMKTSIDIKTDALKTNKNAVNFINDNFDKQLLSEFELERDQKIMIYYAYQEIRNIVKNIYTSLDKSLHAGTAIYEDEPNKETIYSWIAEALNWRLRMELELWKEYQKLWWNNERIFNDDLPQPRFDAQSVRNFINNRTRL